MVLTYDAYNETLELEQQQKSKLDVIEERFNHMQITNTKADYGIWNSQRPK